MIDSDLLVGPRPGAGAPGVARRAVLLAALALATFAALWHGVRVGMPVAVGEPGAERVECVSYAPFRRPGESPFDPQAFVPESRIEQDLALLASRTGCVRTYSVSQGLDAVPAVAKRLGMTVLLGAWLGRDRRENDAEVQAAIALARAHAGTVRAVVVGNEVMLRRELPEAELVRQIRRVRDAVPVPVTYADVWEFWTRHDSLANEVDFVTVHILPFWEDEPVDIELALQHVAETRRHVGEHFAGKKILIGETGWPSAGRQREESKPSRVNQARYIREFVHRAHAEGWDYNLIEAIDQPWKRRLEGTVGGFWGMLDADSLEPKFPLAGAVAEREGVAGPVGGAAVGGVLAFLLATTGRRTRCLRASAIAAAGTLGGMITVLHWEHAHLAYRDALEWSLLGGVAALGALLPLTLARWHGEPVPATGRAARILRHGEPLRAKAGALGLLRGLLLFAAAVAALLLWVDPRYRDFPTLLYLVPAVVLGVVGWWRADTTRSEITLALVILIGVVARWSSEPANPQAVAWLLTGLALALPVLLVRSHQHEQRE